MVLDILMYKTCFGKKRLLGEFVESYVKQAFEYAKSEPTLDNFYKNLIESVAKDCDLNKEIIIKLHHPFHWVFFNSNGSSPFKLTTPIKPLEPIYVQLNNTLLNPREEQSRVLSISNKVIDKYGNLILNKMEGILSQSI